jgi:hypothetical protein
VDYCTIIKIKIIIYRFSVLSFCFKFGVLITDLVLFKDSTFSKYFCSSKNIQIIQILKQMQYFVLMQIYEHILSG